MGVANLTTLLLFLNILSNLENFLAQDFFRMMNTRDLKTKDTITVLRDISELWLNVTFSENSRMEAMDSCISMYRFYEIMHKIPEITHYIGISGNSGVQLSHKSSQMRLLSWFRVGRKTIPDGKDMLHNLLPYMDAVAESKNNIADELQQTNY